MAEMTDFPIGSSGGRASFAAPYIAWPLSQHNHVNFDNGSPSALNAQIEAGNANSNQQGENSALIMIWQFVTEYNCSALKDPMTAHSWYFSVCTFPMIPEISQQLIIGAHAFKMRTVQLSFHPFDFLQFFTLPISFDFSKGQCCV